MKISLFSSFLFISLCVLFVSCGDKVDQKIASGKRVLETVKREFGGKDTTQSKVDSLSTSDTKPAGQGWTTGMTERKKEHLSSIVLKAVRYARQEGFDRVVFEFEDKVPGYRLEYVNKPVRRCGSGNEVTLAGKNVLRVRFTPAQAHNDLGEPVAVPREYKAKLTIIKELEQTCDYEGDVSWVLGLSALHPYRVIELSAPPRLAIDIQH